MPPSRPFCATARLHFGKAGTEGEPGESLRAEGWWCEILGSAPLCILLPHRNPPACQVCLAQDVGGLPHCSAQRNPGPEVPLPLARLFTMVTEGSEEHVTLNHRPLVQSITSEPHPGARALEVQPFGTSGRCTRAPRPRPGAPFRTQEAGPCPSRLTWAGARVFVLRFESPHTVRQKMGVCHSLGYGGHEGTREGTKVEEAMPGISPSA